MIKKKRICVVTTNRADYVKLKSVLEFLSKDPDVELLTIITGSHLLRNYDNTVDLIRSDGFPVSYTTYIEVDGRIPVTMAKSAGLATSEFATAFHNLNPDIVVLHGDRFEMLAAAVAASLMNLFIVHIEGGEITGTIDEHIRHAVTKLAHCHFPATRQAKINILKLGEKPENVFCAGCPGVDNLLKAPHMSLEKLEEQVNKSVKEKKRVNIQNGFLLCVQHPVTTEYGQGDVHVKETLEALLKSGKETIILWPNIDAGADDISQTMRVFLLRPEVDKVTVFRNFIPDIFLNLLKHASVMVGNSSSGIREAGYFGTPVVNIGTRQIGRIYGKNVINAGYNRNEIFSAIQKQLKHGRYKPEYLYGKGGAGKKIARILKSVDTSAIQKRLSY